MIDLTRYYKNQLSAEKFFNKDEVIEYVGRTGLKGKRILDIGCGNDVFLEVYLKRFVPDIHYCGIDLSITSPSSSRSIVDMHDLEVLKNEFFTDVFLFNTLEHSPAPVIVLCNVNKVLEKDGIIHVILPTGIGHEIAQEHFMVPSEIQLISLLTFAGFNGFVKKNIGTVWSMTAQKVRDWRE